MSNKKKTKERKKELHNWFGVNYLEDVSVI